MVEDLKGNPLKFDPTLKGMLDKLEHIKSYTTFKRWRGSFLAHFETFLEQSNIDVALAAYQHFSKNMQAFVKDTAKVQDHVEKGELSIEKYTVKAKTALGEMTKVMFGVTQELDELIPSSATVEKQKGYNKFHMGAVLIRDDFAEYGRLTACGDILSHMRKVSLNEVADKQILEEMDNYGVKLQKFCDVMADLGLYELMMKCLQFVEADPYLDFIFLDLKTGGIGEIGREELIEKGVVSISGKDSNDRDLFSQAATDVEAQERILKMLKESPKLGLVAGNADSTFDQETVGLEEADAVKNLWGVQLRKTPKNKKGEELIFVDQKTRCFGEISRKNCIEKEILHSQKDGSGKEILGEAESNHEERGKLVETLRGLLDLGIKVI
jgi:hypothetical protein